MGERLIQALFRLLQVVKIHQPNNALFIESIKEFREALAAISAERDTPTLRVIRGRFYLDEERLNLAAALVRTADKLIEYLEARSIHGLRFYMTSDLADEEIVKFVRLLNQAEREDDPLAWLQVRFDVEDCALVELLTEHDLKSSGSGAGSEEEGDDEGRKSSRQTTASMVRKTYSHALTSIVTMTKKLASQQRVGIQKSKRVIQTLIDILSEDESILLGMSTIRNYDDYTYTHSVNVAILAMCLGKRLGLGRPSIEQLGLCALFHDLGKVEVPLDLIQKTGALTQAEYDEVKTHSVHSVSQILRLNADHGLKKKILLPPFEHHLGADLSGYPKSDRTAPLSLYGRILMVADIYDAMTSGRTYRPEPISPDKALKHMVDYAGGKIDAIVMKAFIDMIGVYPVGTLLFLDTREVGLVLETPEGAENSRPRIILLQRGPGDTLLKGARADLAERDPATGTFLRNIIRCFHPTDYGIQPADFLV
jgi:HD-GYP domain-containing protein (c-di-GMP phosphodiesterase class II)